MEFGTGSQVAPGQIRARPRETAINTKLTGIKTPRTLTTMSE